MQLETIEQIMARLDKLYRDLPLEYCGYALTAIQDIEELLAREGYYRGEPI